MGGGDMRLLPRGAWDGDGGSGVMMVVELWWAAVGRQLEERVASDKGDRIDRFTRNIFGVGQKSPPENFSGDGGVVVAGIRRLAGGGGAAGIILGEREI
ncbi:hypothetical protein Tco_0943375 [Tanacetum coccineum]